MQKADSKSSRDNNHQASSKRESSSGAICLSSLELTLKH